MLIITERKRFENFIWNCTLPYASQLKCTRAKSAEIFPIKIWFWKLSKIFFSVIWSCYLHWSKANWRERMQKKKKRKNKATNSHPPQTKLPNQPHKKQQQQKTKSCHTTKSQRDHHKSYLLITAVRQNFKEYYIKLPVSIMTM